MIDLALLRQNATDIKKRILDKEPSFDVDALIKLDTQVRTLRNDVEEVRKQKNNLAAQGAKGLTPEMREQSITLGKQLKEKEIALTNAEQELQALWLACPNIPFPDLPIGNKEANKSVREWSSKPTFAYTPKHHVDLNEQAKWFDFQTGANISGAQFPVYRGMGTKIIYALTRMMLKQNASAGFEPVIPPYLVQEKALYNAGNLPKFDGAYYRIADEKLCLIPTSEVSLTNFYADSILPASELPRRMTSWTSCFRKEAGGYGSLERGLIRVHQFEKVELYSICQQEQSEQELEFMVGCAEQILQKLGLHYRVSLLATQDCSFQSAKTYDIEVWLAGQQSYYEVSSCSNCTDFQARRAQIRYRNTAEEKPKLAHTLNASSLALPRLMVALMENYQQPDGSIKLPKVLQDEIDALW